MSSDTRFRKGRSGNPKGRPKKRRPHISAFDIIFDKRLFVTQNGIERELTVDEALEFQTYQAAIKGSRMAVRKVLKMIEKREAALAKKSPQPTAAVRFETEHDADNANEAMRILGIAEYLDEPGRTLEQQLFKLNCWATQAALSRPGRQKFEQKHVEDIKHSTFGAENLRWPRGRVV